MELKLERKCGNFMKEEGATGGLCQLVRPIERVVRGRIGYELARFLHRMFFGHRRPFDGDERAIRHGTKSVNQLSEKRFASPRLTDDQDRRSGRRDRDGEIDHLAPARIVADHAKLASVLIDALWWNEGRLRERDAGSGRERPPSN